MASLKLKKFGNKTNKFNVRLDNYGMSQGFAVISVAPKGYKKDLVSKPIPIYFLAEIDCYLSRSFCCDAPLGPLSLSFDNNYNNDNKYYNGVRFRKEQETYVLEFFREDQEKIKTYKFNGVRNAYAFRDFIREYVKKYYNNL